MIAYTTIGVSDMEKAKAFYLAVLEDLGVTVFMDTGRLAALGSPAGGPISADGTSNSRVLLPLLSDNSTTYLEV